jgi:hypothetical protein
MVLAAPGPLLTLQTAGLQDGVSHCAKILSSMYVSPNSDPSDPDVIIKLDISNTFNVLCRRLTLDILGARPPGITLAGLKRVTILRLFVRSYATSFLYFKPLRTT